MVGLLGRISSRPTHDDWSKVQRVFKYLKGTIELGWHIDFCEKAGIAEIVGYIGAEWASCHQKRRYTSGTVVMVNGTPVIWK